MQASVPYLDDASTTMVIVKCLNEDPTHPAYLHLYDFISSLITHKNTLQGTKAYWQAPLSILLHQRTPCRLFRFVLGPLFSISMHCLLGVN